MTKKSDNFEKQIARVHELLVGNNSKVTWNDKISDPDNPSKFRQIDFTIKNDGTFTMGECRFRKEPEDVTWIEELIGRKASLRADGIIAVSSSGFTSGAIKKAAAFGIVIRNFFEITERELTTWGKKTQFKITFIKLSEVVFEIAVSPENRGPYRLTNELGKDYNLLGIFQAINEQIDKMNPTGLPATFKVDLAIDNLFVGGEKIKSFRVSGRSEKYDESIKILSIFCYSENKGEFFKESAAFVQKFDLAQSEIIGYQDNVSILLDFSSLDLQVNTFLFRFATDFGRVVNNESLEILGIENAFKNKIRMKLKISKSNE